MQAIPLLQGLRLVGGTALALQLGHRKSVDLDLFGDISAEGIDIRDALEEHFSVSVIKESKNIKVYQVEGIKVDLVNYSRYPWIDNPIQEDDIILAGLKDIAAMKSLAYFEDAEADPMPFMFDNTDWGSVKANIREAITSI